MGRDSRPTFRHLPKNQLGYVEASDERRRQMADTSIERTSMEQASGRTEIVILAVPDRPIGTITREIVPRLNPDPSSLGQTPQGLTPV